MNYLGRTAGKTGSVITRRLCLASMLSLAGCVTPAIVFDRTNLARIKRIGVLTPGFPARPDIAVLPPTSGAMFLLVNSIQSGNRGREFAEVVARAGVNPEQAFTTALVKCLQQSGMQPTLLTADPRRTSLPKDNVAVRDSELDAVLDVVVTKYGYYAVTQAAPFRPVVEMQARLVDARSRTVLMQDSIDMVNIAQSDPTGVSYQDYSDIAKDPTGAVQGVMSAMDVAATAICRRLA